MQFHLFFLSWQISSVTPSYTSFSFASRMNPGKITTLVTLHIFSTIVRLSLMFYGCVLLPKKFFVYNCGKMESGCICVSILIRVTFYLYFLARIIWYFMSQVNWAEDRLESKHNSTQSSFWRHLGDHPLVPVLSYVSSLNTLSWIWPKKKYMMLDTRCLKGPAPVVRHRLFIAFLFSVSVAHSWTVRVPWLHVSVCLEEGGCWNVCGKNDIFDVACSLLMMPLMAKKNKNKKKRTRWQDLCLLAYIVMPSAMQLYTLYWPNAHVWTEWS